MVKPASYVSTRAKSPAWPVYVLIFLLPLEIYGVDLLGDVHVVPAFAFLMAFLPIFVLHLLSGQVQLLKTPVTGLFLFYLMVSLATIAGTDDSRSALRGWGASGLMVVAYLYIVVYLDTPEKIERAITCFILIGLLVAVMGLTEFIGYVFFGEIIHPPFALRPQQSTYEFAGGLMRMHGFFGSSNRLGSYLMIPLGLTMYRCARSWANRWLYLLCAVVLGLTIILSLARNALLALITSFIVLHVLRRGKNTMRVAAITMLLLLVMTLTFYVNPVTEIAVLDRFRLNPFEDNVDEFSSSKLFTEHLYTAILAGFQNFGFGRGVQNYDDWAYNTGLVSEWGAHSNFLNFLGETGIVGFTTQVMVVLYLVDLSRRHINARKERYPLVLFLIATYLGVVITGIVRTYYYTEYVWVLIGLILRSIQVKSGNEEMIRVAPRDAPYRSVDA